MCVCIYIYTHKEEEKKNIYKNIYSVLLYVISEMCYHCTSQLALTLADTIIENVTTIEFFPAAYSLVVK